MAQYRISVDILNKFTATRSRCRNHAYFANLNLGVSCNTINATRFWKKISEAASSSSHQHFFNSQTKNESFREYYYIFCIYKDFSSFLI